MSGGRKLALIAWIGMALATLVHAIPVAAGEAAPFAAQFAEAKKHVDARRYDDAIRIYTDIIRSDPRQHSAYNLRSIAFTHKGMRPQSLEDARKAVDLEPKNATYRFNLGYDYYYASRYDEALAEFEQAEQLGYRPPALSAFRAAAKLNKGDLAAAIEDATKALGADPKYAFAAGVRGRAYHRGGQFKEAIPDYATYLRAFPNDQLAIAEQGYAYHQLGMQEQALQNARRMLELDPRLTINFSGDQLLGVYDRETRRARVKEHVSAASKAESEGNWSEAFEQFAAARFWMMGYTSADRAYESRVQKGLVAAYRQLVSKPDLPENARRYVVQARTYIKDKRFEDAHRALNHALALAPWFPTLHYDRALVLGELKQYNGAIAEMKWYLELVPNAPDARQVQDKIYEWEARMK
jgi:tetratricopeptide (TPR) repeat protein